MAIALSTLAQLLSLAPEAAVNALVEGHLLSPSGMAHLTHIQALVKSTHQGVVAANASRSAAYFETTGPQPEAGFQALAEALAQSGFLR